MFSRTLCSLDVPRSEILAMSLATGTRNVTIIKLLQMLGLLCVK